jgi:hypothetical protein
MICMHSRHRLTNDMSTAEIEEGRDHLFMLGCNYGLVSFIVSIAALTYLERQLQ